MSNYFVSINTVEERINKFEIGSIFNPTLYVNKVLIYQVEIYLKETFRQISMKGIKLFMRKKDICLLRLKQKNPTKVYRVLGCILSYVIDNYVCIDHLCCHSKKISVVSSAQIF